MLTSHELLGFMSPALALEILTYAHETDKPLYRATLKLRDRPKRAKAFNKSTELRRSGHKVELRVEDIHEVIEILY